jgi:hypothetical protein
MLEDADRLDQAEDASTFEDHGDERLDRVSADLGDRARRRDRIRRAALELEAEAQRRAHADEERERAALARRRRSEDGQPVVGRIPNGPHRLAEARAHLAREIAIHEAKLDRYAALAAAGMKPMGRPPLPMADSSRVARARRVVRNAEAAAEKAAAVAKAASPAKNLPTIVANTTDPQSRIMPTRRGFLQGFNAQFAVTGDQLIVAVQVGQSTNDQGCFVSMMRAAQDAAAHMRAVTGHPDHVIGTVLADAGYNSDANLNADGPDRLIALGKGRDQARAATDEPAHGALPRARPEGRRTRTGSERTRAATSTSAAERQSNPASAT